MYFSAVFLFVVKQQPCCILFNLHSHPLAIFVISSNIDDATAMINEKVRELIKTYCGLYREVDSADVKQIDRSKFTTIIHSKYIS